MEVTDGTFDEILNENPLVVVDCWAPWCGPCRMIAPVIEELANQYSGRIVFGKLNVDDNKVVAAKFGIMSIPTLLVMKEGAEADRIVGFGSKDDISARLEKHL